MFQRVVRLLWSELGSLYRSFSFYTLSCWWVAAAAFRRAPSSTVLKISGWPTVILSAMFFFFSAWFRLRQITPLYNACAQPRLAYVKLVIISPTEWRDWQPFVRRVEKQTLFISVRSLDKTRPLRPWLLLCKRPAAGVLSASVCLWRTVVFRTRLGVRMKASAKTIFLGRPAVSIWDR